MREIVLRIIYCLVLYLPLEDFLLKWIPVPYPVYLGLRQVSDVFILVAVGITIGTRLRSTRRFRIIGRGADLCLVFFVVLALVTVVARRGDILVTVLNLKALLRYILLVYVLLNLRIERSEVYTFLWLIYVSLGVQFVTSLVQLVGPVSVDRFFFPRVQDTEIAGVKFGSTAYKEAEKGYVFGTMANTISYAGFLLVGLATYVTRYIRDRRDLFYWGAVAVFLFLAYMSGSRAVTFAVVLLVGVDHYLSGETGQFLKVIVVILTISSVMVFASGVDPRNMYIFEVFSSEYIDVAMEQRLGIVLNTFPYFLTNLSAQDVLFGLSPDRSILNQFVSGVIDVPKVLIRNVGIIEDVYWVSLSIYYGLIGFTLFISFYGLTFWQVCTVTQYDRGLLENRMARIALILLFLSIPLNLIAQYFETRQFSFYLWLLVGVSLSYTYTRTVTDQRSSS